jgi:hypothetical protein
MISLFALIACGGEDTGQTTGPGGAPLAPAAGERAGVPDAPEPPAMPHPQVQSCLDLIRQAAFERALPVCLAALSVDPDNEEVKAAVAKARSEAAKLAAAEEAAEGAAEDAASKLGEAAGGVKLGQ